MNRRRKIRIKSQKHFILETKRARKGEKEQKQERYYGGGDNGNNNQFSGGAAYNVLNYWRNKGTYNICHQQIHSWEKIRDIEKINYSQIGTYCVISLEVWFIKICIFPDSYNNNFWLNWAKDIEQSNKWRQWKTIYLCCEVGIDLTHLSEVIKF